MLKIFTSDQMGRLYSSKIAIYFLAFFTQIAGIILVKFLFTGEVVIHDPRFLQVAENLLNNNSFTIEWGVGNNPAPLMQNPFNIQKGIYSNWFPNGYSVFVYLILLFDKSYTLLVVVQLLLFSFIPLIFSSLLTLFYGERLSNKSTFFFTLLFIFNPYFMVSSLWRSDTWLITFFTLLSFLFFLRAKSTKITKEIAVLASLLAILFFLKAIAVFGFYLLLLFTVIIDLRNERRINWVIKAISPSLLIISLWTLNNYYHHKSLSFTYSNVGYNLWLGNNAHTLPFLSKHLGDGSTIEDRIIPLYDNEWSFLSEYSEYEKDSFFKAQAINFILNNPVETIKNSAWKFFGFWSPVRMREGHWSDSSLKSILVVIYQGPFLVFALLSIIFFKFTAAASKENKKYIIIFLFLWMLPHLIFFSSARFRAPVDFVIMILAIDFILTYFTKIKAHIMPGANK